MKTIKVPADILKDRSLCAAAKMLYVAACERTYGTDGIVNILELGQAAGMKDGRTVRRHLRDLAAAGWVEVSPLQKDDPALGKKKAAHRAMRRPGPKAVLIIKVRNPIMEAALQKVRAFDEGLAAARSRGEFIMKALLDIMVDDDDYEDNARPDFLRNPRTGQNLECDRRYRSRRVVIEYNGAQHYGPTRLYPDEVEAAELQARDLMKAALCDKAGVKLIIVHPEDLSFGALGKKIGTCLPRRPIDMTDPYVKRVVNAANAHMRKLRDLAI